jgi:glycosyltransferase involved in cell wall biosynthesis
MRPLVSICIPTYNGHPFLRQCLESALAQTLVDCEVVVLDDASQDGTAEIAKEYARQDRRVRLYRNGENLGSVQNRNRCIELARGEWIKLLFQDNYLEPHCLASMLGALQPGASLAVFKHTHIVEPGVPVDLRERYERYVAEHTLPQRFGDCSLIQPAAFATHVAHYPTDNCVGEPTVTLVHRSAFHRFGRFHPHLVQLNDWEFVARVAVHTGLCYIDEPLGTIRLHERSTTARNYARRRYRAEVIDPIVILHDLVYHETYAPVRAAASQSSPRINLRHRLMYAARQARRQAQYLAAGGAGAEELSDWEEAVTRYPRLLRLSPGYILSAGWGRTKGGLRMLRESMLHALPRG